MAPTISVITTVYNCENFLTSSIRSILEQTFTDFEHIIVNDGSSDNTIKIIDDFASMDKRIVSVNNRVNLGRVRSLNTALDRAKGRFIAIQDADDVSLPGRFERQVLFLENNPDYVLVGSNINEIDENDNIISSPIRPENNLDVKFSLLFKCTLANASIMYRKEIIDNNNIRYEDNFVFSEDFRIISKISQHGKIYNIRDPLTLYRRHPHNNSILYSHGQQLGSEIIVKDNLSALGFRVSDEQVYRIRNLVSSKGINKQFVYNDVKFIFEIIKAFQSRYKDEKNYEVLTMLKRMTKWLGKKNLIKPKYLSLYASIAIFYLQNSFTTRD